MKAYLYQSYGSPEVLEQKEIAAPVPGPKELLIKVYASTVTAGVTYVRQGFVPDSKLKTLLVRFVFGIRKPRRSILGYEFAGIVEAVGAGTTLFKKGDAVYGTATGLKAGSYADYLVVPETWRWGVVSRKPHLLNFEQAAALPIGAMTALHILLKAKIKSTDHVLIYGGSGSVGTYTIQIAKYFGARVTAVCSSGNLSLVSSLGADIAVDYTKKHISDLEDSFDIVMDTVGKINRAACRFILKKEGIFCSVKSMTSENQSYLDMLHQMIEEQKLVPVIDRTYSFSQLKQAHYYVDKGHKKGNVVINHLL
ncbi:NAD(P)-dependent alcohol dehydrogenase [Niabella sp. 22666]|uniref:NAD(P)-dependent alcohol dehydrogenase n=1 Tax=Niabella sp. 22666 TaxID=3453954 RepID=UPI003F854837